jgi:hypothetical protein
MLAYQPMGSAVNPAVGGFVSYQLRLVMFYSTLDNEDIPSWPPLGLALEPLSSLLP